jgi:stage II sporulation protein D
VTRARVLQRAGAAWATAVVGAWVVAAACRTMQSEAPSARITLSARVSTSAPAVPPPSIRVGVLPDVESLSIGADSGVVVRGRGPGEETVHVRSLPRATFHPAGSGRLRLGETGDELGLATVSSAVRGDFLQANATSYRGILEVRPAENGRLTVVDVVNVEDYLRGVVPNELSPEAFPEIEALKAQAVAARTYALSHLGEYSARGFDVCATASCQVYRGQSSEHPLTDRAVEETRGIVVTWRGRPIHAYYTSTCGGHTEDGKAIFDDDAPYLRGVACVPERSSRLTVRTTASPRRNLPGGPETARNLALLRALEVVDPADADPARLRGIPSDAEVRTWTGRLQAALHRSGCESPVGGALARRATFLHHLVASVCWTERAEHLLVSGSAEHLLPAGDAAQLDGDGERPAVALLVREGLVSPGSQSTLRPALALTRAEALGLVAGVAEKAGAPALAEGELAGLADGRLSVLHGEAASSHVLDAAVRLFRDVGGAHAETSELTLSVGDRVVYVERDGRVVYLESEPARRGAAADPRSRYYRWEVRMTPAQVARAVARYGTVGQIRDIVPERLGVSGRVVELGVVGSAGQLDLKGLQVRWGLGLRENLFVINREKGPRGEVERFVITGKGWGHGVGLCQVGAFGMAEAGATFEEILKHYYTGVSLSRVRVAEVPAAKGVNGLLFARLLRRPDAVPVRDVRVARIEPAPGP